MNDFFGIKPINKEQTLLFLELNNKKKEIITVTGKAGTGKSLILGAYILEMLTSGEFKKVILSKPMEIVGNSKFFGTVPGDADEKFAPFLLNFKYLFEKLSPNGNDLFNVFIKKGMLEFIPVALLRGISFPPGTLVYLDEAQNISDHEINTLGTRLEDGCRLLLSGDINQIDNNSYKFKSGLDTVVNSDAFKKSKMTSYTHLVEVERGKIAKLFTEIFEAK